jgi:ubiquinone/menaquinone biosynthesis C-methylase UbiE
MTGHYFDQSFRASAPENYQRFFVPVIGAPLAEDLLREAALVERERVLDVGCGTGVVTRLAAARVGREGRVVGLDINPGMLAVARSVTPAEDGIEWYEESAEVLPFADRSFDVILCQLSLQFMPDRSRAMAEMHRVLVPGGRLVLNVPGPADVLFETLADAMEHHVAPEAATFVRTVFAMHEEPAIEDLLKQAGFRDVEAHAYTSELELPPAEDFLWQYIGSTPLGNAVERVSDEARAALADEVLEVWRHHEDGDRLPYHQRVVMASAHR